MCRLTILCENTVVPGSGLTGEHGFAVFIEKNGQSYLFDTGQGLGIVHNAEQLGIDLGGISKIFLSHGHYDHTGGLINVLDMAGSIEVHAHPDVFSERRVVVKKDGRHTEKNIGLQANRETLEAAGAEFVFNTELVEVVPGMHLTGEVPRLASSEDEIQKFRLRGDNRSVTDLLLDDQSLIIETPAGLAVVLGCAHSGIINILYYVKTRFPNQKIHMIVGGLHLGNLPRRIIRQVIEKLKAFSIDKTGLSHCTGLMVSAAFVECFGEGVFFANAGTIINLQQ